MDIIFETKRLKNDSTFVGTVALVKDHHEDDEIGYRFLEKYWGNGYGFEIAEGLVHYCKRIGMSKIIANVVNKNEASTKIIKKLGFEFVGDFMCDDKQQDGYLGIESARAAIGITVSYWESLEAITNWKNNLEHIVAREKGRAVWYQQYQLRICKVERDYGFEK